MPSISKKGIQMPESPIRKLAPYAERAVDDGKQIFHLNIGQPDIKTPRLALNAIRNHSLEVLSYSESSGFKSFRDKIASYYKTLDVDVISDDVIITTGGSEALLFVMGCIGDINDEIIIPEPFYANYKSFAIQSNIHIITITSTINDDFSLPDIKEFERCITSKTKAILICNPGNPTGHLYSREEINQLAQLAKKYDLFLIADEVYRDFVYDDSRHYSVLELNDMNEHTIVIDSVSKRYSMCGARIGWLISRNKTLLATATKFAQARLSPPTLAQIAAEAAFDTSIADTKETVAKYKKRRDTLIQGLEQIDGVIVSKPKGAFYCIAELPVDNTEDFTRWLLEHFSVNNQTVMLAPAAGFYANEKLGKKQVRIAYVLNRRDLLQSIHILRLGLQAYNKKK
ncbi:pyridoxal phosphate-dependent aminotransferase [Aquimarina intermedia]|uniref:Aminotransferase n=1 Tax=Aquimarina intermedia TaxID=350814 RepID=A0A5S5C2D9_9FLAO|nr:pyridoxal phosphate-dependent aminotransferase [Aquimarina intermedia]TYP73605.1 aspartate aminotransferase [Aquimarina intermedia]